MPLTRRSAVSAVGLLAPSALAVWGHPRSASAQAPSEELVTIRPGALPVVLTAPHGGTLVLAGAPERKRHAPSKTFTERDGNTSEITLAAAAELERLTGASPHVVIANVSRRFVDMNRPVEGAYGPGAGDIVAGAYETYHRAIAKACEEIARRFGAGLLIDVHGQGVVPGALLRGTDNGATVAGLVQRHGLQSVGGPDSLMGQLAALGFVVFPEVGSTEPEHPMFSGGHTVRTYGRHPQHPVDAIQIEFGSRYRRARNVGTTAAAFAKAIVEFGRNHLTMP